MIDAKNTENLKLSSAELLATPAILAAAIEAQLMATDDLYANLNALRDWVNATFAGVELYLEDVWNDNAVGETHFEYILRSRQTFEETAALAADVYVNHRDAKGVWHLGDYQSSHLNASLAETVAVAVAFLQQHGAGHH